MINNLGIFFFYSQTQTIFKNELFHVLKIKLVLHVHYNNHIMSSVKCKGSSETKSFLFSQYIVSHIKAHQPKISLENHIFVVIVHIKEYI